MCKVEDSHRDKTESFDLVLSSLWNRKLVDRLKQRSDVVSFTWVFSQEQHNSAVVNALKAVDRGSRKTRKERITVAKACLDSFGA